VFTPEEADDPSATALRLATMHRVKGLEFDYVLIPGLNAGVLPDRRVLERCADQVSKDAFEQQERSLLHVAATRARKRLVVTYCGEPSALLQLA
jgi:superfamily I DNA/RNA helicase